MTGSWLLLATLLVAGPGAARASSPAAGVKSDAGGAPPEAARPYYAFGAMVEPLDPSAQAAGAPSVIAEAAALLDARGVRRLTWVEGREPPRPVWPEGEGALGLLALPRPTLAALIDVLGREERGVEADLLVVVGDRRRLAVSVTWSMADHVELHSGAVVHLDAVTEHAKEELEARWGVRLGVEGDARWGPRELHLVDRALQLLDPRARACVTDVPIVLSSAAAPRGPAGRQVGLYQFGNTTHPRIVLFSARTDAQGTAFLGAPLEPVPFDVHLLLHELGHAVGDARERREHAALLPLLDELMAVQDQLREAGAIGEGGAVQGDADTQPLVDALVRVRASLAELGLTSAEGLQQRWEVRRGPSVVERAWAAQMGGQPRPTRYSDTNDVEGFADFFAVHAADPAALRRTHAEVAAWMAEGRHLDCPSP